MKTFFIIDIIIQFLLIIAWVIYFIFWFGNLGTFFFNFYFFVGGWQIVSLVIHNLFYKTTIFYRERSLYSKFVFYTILIASLLSFAGFVFSPLFSLLLVLGLLLLIFSPLIAISYLSICWKEYRIFTKRQFMQLK